jgi:chemotaxis protein CheC
MDYTDLNPQKIDALKEFFNIGAGNAADTVSLMSGEKVMISVPEMHICSLSEVSRYTGEIERKMVGIYHNISGGINGKILMLISKNSGEQITKSLIQTYSANEAPPHLLQNALKEFSNIIIGAYLNAFSSIVKSKIVHSVPFFAYDMTGAIVDSIIATIAERDDFIIVLKTIMTGTSGVFEIYLLFFPEADSLSKLLKDVK